MVGIGIGLGLGRGSFVWPAADTLAARALLWNDFKGGQYAQEGKAVAWPGEWVCTRDGEAYATTVSGALKLSAVDALRVADYSTGSRALLMEDTVTKIAMASAVLTMKLQAAASSANWIASPSVSAYGTSTIAPDGVTSVPYWNAGNRALYYPVSLAAGTNAYGVWIKCTAEGIGQNLALRKPGVSNVPSYGDDASGYEEVVLTGEWQRVTTDGTVGSSGTFNFLFENRTDSGAVGTSYGLAIWGGNAEAGTYASSPVVQTGSAVSRANDIAEYDLTSMDLTDGFWVLADFVLTRATGDFDHIFRIGSDDGSTRAVLRWTNSDKVIAMNLALESVSVALRNSDYTQGDRIKFAGKWDPTSMTFIRDGALLGVNSFSGSFDGFDRLWLANSPNGLSQPESISVFAFHLLPADAMTQQQALDWTAA